jgi:hypothetical protein
MTIQHYEPPPPLPASTPGEEIARGPAGWVARLRAAAEIAGYVGATSFVPEALRGKPDEIAAAILFGEEVGLEPMTALRSVAMIKGTPTLKAEAMRGLVVARGHELWLEESTNTRAIAAGRRAGAERVGRVIWTMDDAKRAGIAGQPNYQKYPREMLIARSTAALVRQMFADVVSGLLAAEELDGYEVSPNGTAALEPARAAAADAPAAPARQRRRRAAAPAAETAREPVAPTPPPDPQPEPEPPPDPLATDAYKRRIFATMRDLRFDPDDRNGRLAYVSRVVGRPISSSNELTIGEASKVIEQLEADVQARRRGEQALIDELQQTFAATEQPHEPTSFTPPPAVRDQLADRDDDFPEGF